MKATLYNFLIALLLFLLSCHSNSIEDKSKRNENWTWFVDAATGKGEWLRKGDRTTVDSGRYTQFYFNGNVRVKGKIVHGKDIDTAYFFDLNGQFESYVVYGEDTLVWYAHDGPIKVYSPTGKVLQQGTVRNHAVGDKWTDYFESGRISSICNFVNDTGWVTAYYENGKLKDSVYVAGPKISIFKKRYYQDGNIEYSAELKNGKIDGAVKQYYENGQLQEFGFLKDGVWNGIMKHYYENGQMRDSGTLVNGKLEGTAYEWYEKGTVKLVAENKGGVINGRWMYYREDGTIFRATHAINGLPEGEVKQYDEQGKLYRIFYWKKGELIDSINVAKK